MRSENMAPKIPVSLLIICVIALSICCISATNLEYENDRVITLPGQPTSPSVSQFSGYITVNEAHGRALFYWFFEAQSQPIKKPLLLWLNGGPGCSSIGYGASVELGPLRVGKGGVSLEFNQHSWNKGEGPSNLSLGANLLFLESPVGVGFSYTNTSSDLEDLEDSFVAEDTYNFLVKWLARFPQFKGHDFFISGESYAGHYVPQLAELVYDRNKNSDKYPYINLKGFIVGNPETHDGFDYKGILEYAWSHSIISDTEYEKAKKACDFNLQKWSTECVVSMNLLFKSYNLIDIYNIYAPSCNLPNSNTSSSDAVYVSNPKAETSDAWRRMKMILGGYDPCYSKYSETYFNRIDVQSALHVEKSRDGVKWNVCSDSVFRKYNYTVFSVLPIYRKLIKGGLKIWVYSGDSDGRVPFIGSRYCVEALELPLKTPWSCWFYNHQVGGRFVEYEGLTFVTVRGAGHLVPLNKPKEALALIKIYLSTQSLSNSTHT